MSDQSNLASTAKHSPDEPALQAIRSALTGLEHGNVTAIVQDGVVIQIERTEKRRLPRRRKPQ